MECRTLINQDFQQLVELDIKMWNLVNPDLTSFDIVNTLVNNVNNRLDFLAIGIFEDEKLLGFLYGYKVSESLFHIDGLYCLKNPIALEQLSKFSVSKLKRLGFKYFTANATNDIVIKTIKKFNIKKERVVYYYKGVL